jgi:hypothetical protein
MHTVRELRAFGRAVIKLAEDKPELVDAKAPPIWTRGLAGALGAGMVVSQLPLLNRYASGRSTLYHATNSRAAEAILGGSGIDPAYAGATKADKVVKGDKAVGARINRWLMGNNLTRHLEATGMPVTAADASEMTARFNALMDEGHLASDAVDIAARAKLDELVGKGAVTADAATAMRARLKDNLSDFGRRSYFGTHPSIVAPWAGRKTEAELAMDSLRRKAMSDELTTTSGRLKLLGSTLLRTFTGNLSEEVKDLATRAKYKPTETLSMPRAAALEHLRKIRAASPDAGVIFGASAPTHNLGYLADFPVVRHLASFLPSVKGTLKDLSVETYEPRRDLSLPHAVPAENLTSMDIIHNGKVQRINISDAVKATRGSIGGRLRGMLVPGLAAGLGAHSIYRAIVPAKRKVPRGHPLAINREADTADTDKLGSIGGDVAGLAKFLAPAIGGASAAAGGATYLMNKALPYEPVDPDLPVAERLKREAAEAGKQQLRVLAGISGSILGGAGVSRALPRIAGLKTPPPRVRTALGGLAGYFGGAGVVTEIEGAREPSQHPYFGALPGGAQDFIRKHPEVVGGTTGALMGTALPLGAWYVLRKYYPSAGLPLREAVMKTVAEHAA